MTAFVLDAGAGLRRLAEPVAAGDKVKAQIARAARAAGLTYWRAFDLWYGKARRVDPAELEAIRAAELRRAQERSDELVAVASEFDVLAGRLAALAAGGDREAADRARALGGRLRSLAAGGRSLGGQSGAA